MRVMSSLFLLGALSVLGLVQAQSVTSLAALKKVALSLGSNLSCTAWDCNCTFTQERGCCCGASDMFANEDAVFERMIKLYEGIEMLKEQVQELAADRKVAFQVAMDNSSVSSTTNNVPCFGPFNTNVSIPFKTVLLNDGMGYNAPLGTFTVPSRGVYMLSFTIASNVETNGLISHMVELMLDGQHMTAVLENNREDIQDSATQYVILQLNKGSQIYLSLVSGRKICTTFDSNIFSGFMLYPI